MSRGLDSRLQTPDSRRLWEGAVRVLRENDLGGWTRPAPNLYPHQWSWDSAVIALGLARLDPDRALRELESLFEAQWSDGRVPQIVYNPAAPPGGYFPDAARWACAELNPAAPVRPATSGLVQPPIHAVAAWRIAEAVPDLAALGPRLAALYRKLLRWHRYLALRRDPDRSGLIEIYHPWESGTDNSPRWDAPLARVDVGVVPPYVRRDLQHVADPSHRPTDAEYDRYLWLLESLKLARYDDDAIRRSHPFLAKDVLFSAIFALASEALGRLAARLDAPAAERTEIAEWARRSSVAVQRRALGSDRWGGPSGLALDVDLRAERPLVTETWAGFALLIVPYPDSGLVDGLERHLWESKAWLASPDLAYRVVPSTSTSSPAFRPRSYWRGPIWPVANWLIWYGLRRRGRPAAEELRRSMLALLGQPNARYSEYFEPSSGEPLGSADQSWTAAVALDWLAES